MHYFFEAKIDLKEQGGSIDIPFNVWEVCKYRDIIEADVMLNNEIIKCELLPVEKGNYTIFIKEDKLKDIDTEMEHKILLYIDGSIIETEASSPYSLENPIRVIDGVDILLQPGDGLCGQTVVAMLAGNTIAEVIATMDCWEWQATMARIVSGLNYYGIDHSQIIFYTQGKTEVVLPKCCILLEKMGRFSHYLLYFDGKFYDPNLGVFEQYDFSKLLGYMEIKC